MCARRVDLVDLLLRRIFTAATISTGHKIDAQVPLALIALGGYGRGELNPFSDVDVMFLHEESKVSPYVGQVVEQILYFLWDVGFKVGHSTRTIRDAVTLANGDMLTKTAMLESRLIAGETRLSDAFRKQFRAKCVVGHEREFVELRMQDQATRHAKYGNSVYMQEPHLKNGCGGLRDYQNLLWLTFFNAGELTTTHLVGKDWLSEPDQRRIDAAYDFLLRLRTDLHYLNDRATDTLHLNMQDEVAKRLRVTGSRGPVRSEPFMRVVYEHCRNIFRVTERITEQFANGYSLGKTRSLFSFLPRSHAKQKKIGEFLLSDKQLDVAQRDLFTKAPDELMHAFEIVQHEEVDLSPALADLVGRRLKLVTRTYQYAKGPRAAFLRILSRKGKVGHVLRVMHRVDFLGRYLPEFGQLTCLVQNEFFHRYTADEHTLVCIEKLDALTTTEDAKFRPYRALFEKLDDPVVLYLALLLHDTGRAIGARPHSEGSALFAQRAASRLQLTSEQRKSLILIVDHHVTLSNTAQQRNVDDPETAVQFGQIVKTQRNLDLLMLLTLADGQGTSDEAWSDWKESLVWNLYRATSAYLADQEQFYQRTQIERASLQREVAAKLAPDYAEEIEAHFEYMPDNYFRAFAVEEIGAHLSLVRQFLQNLYEPERPPLAPTIHWQAFPEHGRSIASFCAWDSRQLLEKIAGSFAVVPINILSADIYTRGDNLVLDIFRVCDARGRAVTNSSDRRLVEETLRSALSDGDFDFEPLLQKARRSVSRRGSPQKYFPTRISVDNRAHPAYTLVQIQTLDRVGLLYDLVKVFSAEEISIGLSRISTEKGAAIDTFYVRDPSGRGKLTDASRIETLQKRLQEAAIGLAESLAKSH